MNGLETYLAGGAAGRADSISGLSPAMQEALTAFFAAAPEGLTINSGYRSPELQARLYADALERYGSEAEARRWVAPPGNSQHNHGAAVDLGFANDAAREWAHENAGQFGLAFPLSNENWHIELAGARGGPQTPADPRQAPMDPNRRPGWSETFSSPENQNALAQLTGGPGNNAFAMLNAGDFMNQGYGMPGQAPQNALMQRFATRYLGGGY